MDKNANFNESRFFQANLIIFKSSETVLLLISSNLSRGPGVKVKRSDARKSRKIAKIALELFFSKTESFETISTDATNGYTDATMGLRDVLTGYAYAFLYLINTLKGYWDVPTAITCTTDFFHYIPYGFQILKCHEYPYRWFK